MKFKAHAMFLSLFLAFAIAFSFSIEADAHDYKGYTHSPNLDIDARDITDPGNAEDIRKLVLHIAKHTDLIEKDETLNRLDTARETSILSRRMREQGVFNNGDDIYLVKVTNRKAAVSSHGRYPDLFGWRYDSSEEPLRTLLSGDVPEFSDGVEPECKEYEGGNRVACSVKLETVAGSITYIAGFHHLEDDPVIIEPACSSPALKLDTTAEDVETETDLEKKRDLLKLYVGGVIRAAERLFFEKFTELQGEGVDLRSEEGLSELVARGLDEAPCFARGDFRHGSIYPFIMEPVQGVSFINGLDFNLQGLSVSLEDPNPIPDDEGNVEKNVLEAFRKTLTEGTGDLSKLVDGNNGFVKYHWDHPLKEDDQVEDFLERGVVPGTSVKESYIEAHALGRSLYVFGSGIYLDSETGEAETDGGDGCAIASADNALQNTFLSLFLTASVLFLAAFLPRRV